MPPKAAPKADGAPADTNAIVGFDARESKYLAAAFVCQLGPDRFDYDLMATLTGNTVGSLKKILPPIKRKAVESHPSLAAFLGATGTAAAGAPKAPKAPAAKKRKTATDTAVEAGDAADGASPDAAEASDDKEKKKPKARGRTKKVKKEQSPEGNDDADI